MNLHPLEVRALAHRHQELSAEAEVLAKRQVGRPDNRRKLAANVAERLKIEGRLR